MSRPAEQWGDWDVDLDDLDTSASPLAAAQAVPSRPAYVPARAPAAAPRRRIRWGQLAVVTIVGYLVVVGAVSEVSLLGVSRRENALGAQAVRLQAANRSLRHEVALLHQPRYVDELARTELGYVSPGEVELVPTTKGAHKAGAGRS